MYENVLVPKCVYGVCVYHHINMNSASNCISAWGRTLLCAERPSEQETLTTEVFLISGVCIYPLCQCFVLAVVLQWAGRPGSHWIMTNKPAFFEQLWGLKHGFALSHLIPFVLTMFYHRNMIMIHGILGCCGWYGSAIQNQFTGSTRSTDAKEVVAMGFPIF